MDHTGIRLSAAELARLARKGQILCEKSCGRNGLGTCAESFVVHQWRLGRFEVARDVLQYLDVRIAALREVDPDARLPATQALAERIRRRLSEERFSREGETQTFGGSDA